MVINETEEIDDVTNKKIKVIEWVDRTPVDCLEEMASLCETIAEKVESRYTKSVCKAAHVLGGRFHIPNIFSLAQGLAVCGFSAHQQSALYAYGKEDFHSFFKYNVCLFLASRNLISRRSTRVTFIATIITVHCLHQLFKDVVVQVVWKNHGDCRKILFPPVEGAHGQGLLKEFKVRLRNSRWKTNSCSHTFWPQQ